MNNFWHDLPRPFFILAPMEAVTDVVFRHVVAHAARPDVFFTEFTNASSYCSPKGIHSTRGRLAFTPDEHPMVAQIWGSKPEEFAHMGKGLAEMGYRGIDINMGCPVKNVVKSGGSYLIRQPEIASELIAAAKQSGLPVSVKTRLGYSSITEWHDWLAHLLKQDITNLTIHLRTRKEMSKVDAHHELIPEIVKLRDEIAPGTLLTINGDIRDRAHGLELVERYGVDGIMIGRGIFHNPFAFEDASATTPARVASGGAAPENVLGGDQKFSGADRTTGPAGSDATSRPEGEDDASGEQKHTKEELLNLLRLHLDLFDKYSQELEPRRFEPLKRFFKIYVREFPGASELREQLMHAKSTDEVREILNKPILFENPETQE